MPRRPGPPSPQQDDPTAFPRVHLAAHHTVEHVSRQVRKGAWLRVRRGAYVDADLVATRTGPPRARLLALARIAALGQQLATPPTFTRSSAALVWGLPLQRVPTVTHLNQPSRPTARGARDVVRHVAAIPDQHRTTHRGHAVTTLERTAVDCALTLGPLDGLVVLDAALHRGADPLVLRSIVDGMVGHRGVRQARALLEVADDGAESAGETWARFTVLRLGLPRPETQVRVTTDLGDFWADLGWREWRLLIEYDGREKYGTAGEDAVGALRRERRRQLAVEEEHWRVLRLTAPDQRTPDAVATRVLRALPPGTRPTLHPDPHLQT